MIHNLSEGLGIVLEVEIVFVYDHHASSVFVVDEIIVALVQVPEIFQLHLLLIVASALLDVAHEVGHRCAQINHEVGVVHHLQHLFEKLHVGVVVTIGEIAHSLVVLHEHIYTLEDATVLHNGVGGTLYVDEIAEALQLNSATVRTKLARGREKLRQTLIEGGYCCEG